MNDLDDPAFEDPRLVYPRTYSIPPRSHGRIVFIGIYAIFFFLCLAVYLSGGTDRGLAMMVVLFLMVAIQLYLWPKDDRVRQYRLTSDALEIYSLKEAGRTCERTLVERIPYDSIERCTFGFWESSVSVDIRHDKKDTFLCLLLLDCGPFFGNLKKKIPANKLHPTNQYLLTESLKLAVLVVIAMLFVFGIYLVIGEITFLLLAVAFPFILAFFFLGGSRWSDDRKAAVLALFFALSTIFLWINLPPGDIIYRAICWIDLIAVSIVAIYSLVRYKKQLEA